MTIVIAAAVLGLLLGLLWGWLHSTIWLQLNIPFLAQLAARAKGDNAQPRAVSPQALKKFIGSLFGTTVTGGILALIGNTGLNLVLFGFGLFIGFGPSLYKTLQRYLLFLAALSLILVVAPLGWISRSASAPPPSRTQTAELQRELDETHSALRREVDVSRPAGKGNKGVGWSEWRRNDTTEAQRHQQAPSSPAGAGTTASGKGAEGKLLSETVLSENRVAFAPKDAELTPEAKAQLDQFTATLKNANKSLYIEIQGHSDAKEADPKDCTLGEKRAEAVRRYLNGQAGFPLAHMSTISYCGTAPVGDNATAKGRAENRRVILVVVQ